MLTDEVNYLHMLTNAFNLHRLTDETASSEPIDVNDKTIADAWIQVMHDRRAIQSLESLQPEPGDIVKVPPFAGEELREIASFTSDGQLNFRGGGGQRARPHNVQMFARKSDKDYDEALFKARQQAAGRIKHPELVSARRADELQQWRVSGTPGIAASLALEDALASAVDERPLQEVLEKYPEILAYLVTGHYGIYVIPRPKLGKEYVPDFLIAAETSNGLQWTLVEIESPTAALTISDGQHSSQLRKAIQQIIDWREWLSNSANYARRSVADNGLGLPGIRADARGLIIISRADRSTTHSVNRMRELNDRNIEIRTYDWLVRACQISRGLPFGVLDAERTRIQ